MTEISNQSSIGRNEPCPCKSGKKYKRCCGVAAAPKLSVSNRQAMDLPSNPNMPMDPSALEGMNPELLMQFTQALQRLPKGQIQRFQTLMQKAMNGKDVSKEAAEFEKTLPVEFQTMMQSMGAMGMAMGGGAGPAAAVGDFSLGNSLGLPSGDREVQALEAPLSEGEARALVAKAAAEGKITKEQANALLKAEPELEQEIRHTAKGEDIIVQGTPVPGESGGASDSKLKKFWKNISKK